VFFAAQLFGTHLSWLLFGFIIAQTYTYYTRPAKDRTIFAILVYFNVFLAVAQTAVEGFLCIYWLVSSWGDPLVLSPTSVSGLASADVSNLQPFLGAIPAIFVQFFFIWRIWSFCRAIYGRKVKILVAGICFSLFILSLCSFFSALINLLLSLISSSTPLDYWISMMMWSGSSAVADVAITICMIIVLHQTRTTASSPDTYHKITHLLRITIQTGFLTSALAVFVLATILARDNLYLLPWFLLGKSYMITLLANINARSSRLQTTRDILVNEPNSSGATLSLFRAIAHNFHRDLTSVSSEVPTRGLALQPEEARSEGIRDNIVGEPESVHWHGIEDISTEPKSLH